MKDRMGRPGVGAGEARELRPNEGKPRAIFGKSAVEKDSACRVGASWVQPDHSRVTARSRGRGADGHGGTHRASSCGLW